MDVNNLTSIDLYPESDIIMTLFTFARAHGVLDAVYQVAPEGAREKGPTLRVGRGKATNHRRGKGNEKHVITFGPKMVADKFHNESGRIEKGEGCWLSSREIRDRGYMDGDTDFDALVLHALFHELAHFIQTLRGERRKGEVHNAGFYQALNELYAAMGKDKVQSLRDEFRNQCVEGYRKRVANRASKAAPTAS